MAFNANWQSIINTIAETPLLDNHAHNLLDADIANNVPRDPPLEACFSEAQGAALTDSMHTLPHSLAVRQLAKLYQCDEDWESVKKARDQLSLEDLCRLCFSRSGIQCVLMDNGLVAGNRRALPFEWHDSFLPNKTKRIVRIEHVAEGVLATLWGAVLPLKENEPTPANDDDADAAASTSSQTRSTLDAQIHQNISTILKQFKTLMLHALRTLARSTTVVAFKSIAAYRSGLNIGTSPGDSVLEDLHAHFLRYAKHRVVRLTHKALIDFVVYTALEVACEHELPMQFHAGFGDNDLDLIYANPLHLKNIIEMFPTAKIVILHAAYPYAREAGYLASVYPNVFVDFGLVQPMVSKGGQRKILKELFEMTPLNKLLFSTDGHLYPETFYISALQAKEALSRVLLDAVKEDELTVQQAIMAAKNILFENANKLYKLNLVPVPVKAVSNALTPAEVHSHLHELGIQHVRLIWVDAANMHRCRVIPLDRFATFFRDGTATRGVSLAKAAVALLFNYDAVAPGAGVNATGEVFMVPDLATLRKLPYHPTHAICFTNLQEKEAKVVEGNADEKEKEHNYEFDVCPRTTLRHVLRRAKEDLDINFLVGFETEVVFLRETYPPVAIDDSLYSSTSSWHANSVGPKIADEIVEALAQQRIEVLQFHSESAPGQFEFVTGPLSPLEAVDALVLTRETVYNVAAKHGVKATLLPKPFPMSAGTASHMHISLKSTSSPAATAKAPSHLPAGLMELEAQFMAGLLRHLRALCAFTLPNVNSYNRIVDHCWAGTWACWGVENRETPLRVVYTPATTTKPRDYNFELKCFDGTANPYLATAAIISAGLDGVRNEMKVEIQNCEVDPALLTPEVRRELGITDQIPKSIHDSLVFLKQDNLFERELGKELMQCFIAVREAEVKYVEGLSPEDAMKLLLSRY